MKSINEAITDAGFKNQVNRELKKNYDEAMKKESFKLIVSKLKLKDELLIKYTSTLEECANNYETCINCKNILECPYKMEGYCYLPKVTDGKITFQYQPCKYKKHIMKKNRYLDNIYLFDIPKEIKEASIEHIYMKDANRIEAIEWIHKFIKSYLKDCNQKGLYLHGNFGCGKTYLVAATFNELAKQNIKSAIIYWPEYLRDLKSSFQTDFKEKYEAIKKVPLLLIDDIGAENTTVWGRDEILGPILQYRMQEGLTTFFTSNLDINSLEEHFSISKDGIEVIKSKRICERINQLTDNLKMISKNLRK